jgi:hypothetical protein
VYANVMPLDPPVFVNVGPILFVVSSAHDPSGIEAARVPRAVVVWADVRCAGKRAKHNPPSIMKSANLPNRILRFLGVLQPLRVTAKNQS